MVGYEMGSSRVGVYQWRTSSVNGKNDMVGQHSNTFCKGSSPEVKFLGQPQTLGQETWPLENSNLRLFFLLFFPSCMPWQPLSQITVSWRLKFLTNWSTSPPWSKPALRLRPWEWVPTAHVLAHLPLVVVSLKKGAL